MGWLAILLLYSTFAKPSFTSTSQHTRVRMYARKHAHHSTSTHIYIFKPYVCPNSAALHPSCSAHANCDKNEFCATECFTGKCGPDNDIALGTKGEFCQPCAECRLSFNSITGLCNVCPGNKDGNVGLQIQFYLSHFPDCLPACTASMCVFVCALERHATAISPHLSVLICDFCL